VNQGKTHFESLGYRKGVYKPRKEAARVLIIHTTGGGIIRRYKASPGRWKNPFETALWVYGNVMTAGPHYVVGQEGQAEVICPLTHAAHHVGVDHKTPGKSPQLYQKPWWQDQKETRYGWWFEEPGRDFLADSPITLPGEPWGRGKRLSCNMKCDGLEIVPPDYDPTMKDFLSEEVLDAVAYIALNYDYVYSHSEVHPLARTNHAGKAWDTPQPIIDQVRWKIRQRVLKR
jgi:hypothetical protein